MFCGGGASVMAEYQALENSTLFEALRFDDVEAFVSFIDHEIYAIRENQRTSLEGFAIELVSSVCRFPSIMCAKALISGETPLKNVDINCHDDKGVYPIHHASWSCWPNITNLFLKYGALPNVPCEADDPSFNKKIPITLALERLSKVHKFENQINCGGVFQLLLTFCSPREIHALRSIGLLASETNFKYLEEELYRFFRDGKLIEFAGLLIVARKKLIDPISKIREFISCNKSNVLIDEEMKQLMSFVHLLLDVTETEGDAMEAYFMKEREVSIEEDSWEECTLRQVVKPGHEWLGDFHWPKFWKEIQNQNKPRPKGFLKCPERRARFMDKIRINVGKIAGAKANVLATTRHNSRNISCTYQFVSPVTSISKVFLF